MIYGAIVATLLANTVVIGGKDSGILRKYSGIGANTLVFRENTVVLWG